MRKTFTQTILFYILHLVMAFVALPMCANAQIVIVVQANCDIDSLSIGELKNIFKGQSVDVHESCQIVEFTPLSDDFYQSLYGLSAYAIAKHWLRLMFSGERVRPPKSFSNGQKCLEFITEHEHSIGFITLEIYKEMKNDSLRAVVIDGRSYKDPQYALQENPRKE